MKKNYLINVGILNLTKNKIHAIIKEKEVFVMTLIDTVQIYTTPLWFIAIMIVAGSALVITLIEGHSDKAVVIACICVLILAIGMILGLTGIVKVYDHDEYIIELDESASATEFFKNYEITKTFEYSNAWQVKKKDGVN